MTLGSILLAVALLLLVLLFLAHPFLAIRQPELPSSPQQRLQDQKEGLLNAIRALDFDHDTGKLPTAVYQPQRQQLINEAAIRLQQIDQLAAEPTARSLEAEIEAAVARLRQKPAANGRFCPHCGQPTQPSDNFCPACGHPLAAKTIS